ncbi:hypothetical protein TEA_017646 [Camellia sinensis var. sinensis]|uniref:SAWADEE domain-containing protein n=1 Tax=Camellia sinensis var. sinensis TaxID=542762 RepID=A0A4S4DYG0_CAMSN|nr:hypothetical protein TEA_017646 [Camellia sinensis var. sinensis]
MDTFEYTEMDDDLPEFTLAEIMEMEGKFKEVGEKSLSQDFCQELVASFNCSKHRTGKSAIGWEQVQSWFLDKQREVEAKVTTSPFAPKEFNSPLTPESPQKPKGHHRSSWFWFNRNPRKPSSLVCGPSSLVSGPFEDLAERIAGLSELVFEAKSAKDWACSVGCPNSLVNEIHEDLSWGKRLDVLLKREDITILFRVPDTVIVKYDVASFLNYRIVSSGELFVPGLVSVVVEALCNEIELAVFLNCSCNEWPDFGSDSHPLLMLGAFGFVVVVGLAQEVRVRFAGFRYEEDEWVNVKRGIRERSIPLEPSECHQVKVGDLVLCFRENEDLAIYCDAYIVQIQRRVHDATGCKCIFVVRYDYDDAEVWLLLVFVEIPSHHCLGWSGL